MSNMIALVSLDFGEAGSMCGIGKGVDADADASRRYDRRDHDGHGMAAAFSARLSCRRGP